MTTVESLKSAIRDFYAAIDRAQGMSPLDSFSAPTYLARFPGMPEMDREGIKQFGDGFYAACPGLTHRVEEVLADGDRAAVRLTIHGTHSQPLMTPAGPIPAAGTAFEFTSINTFRFEGDKVVEHWAAFDMLSFLQQIGAMPAPPSA